MNDVTTPAAVEPVAEPTAAEPTKRQMSFHSTETGDIIATFEGLEPLNLSLAAIPESVKIAAITEGLISRARSATSRHQGTDRTPENLRMAVLAAFTNLQSGIWKLDRVSTSGEPEYSVEIIAAFEFRKGKTLAAGKEFTDSMADIAAMWDGLTDEQRKQIKGLPRYQAAYASEKARRATERAAMLLKKAEKEEAAAAM